MSALDTYKEIVDCDGISKSEINAIRLAKKWKFDMSYASSRTFPTSDRCEEMKAAFAFPTEPLSREEETFPLAYGIVVHKNPMQVLYMLSAIYQPQNQYCIAVDCKASEIFKKKLTSITNCFGNMHVIYLSGGDLPLKTNLEMVRIFKALNGSFNSVVADYQSHRAGSPDKPSPVTLWKSSLSATFSRESANFIVSSRTTSELLQYLSKAFCPDEAIWTNLGGNVYQLPIPGGFNSWDMRQKLEQVFGTVAYARGRTEFGLYQPEKYYISRFQIWSYGFMPCYGKHLRSSCCYGVRDVP
uniref:Core-2/I-Branching enzyme n=1 Tax=Steinernema glaseri TaxID=37863 RepID=A0A1I7YSE0_9BILA